MAGPAASDGAHEGTLASRGTGGEVEGGEGGGLQKGSGDPTAGSDTPVTVAGNPTPFTPKNPPCQGIREVHICIGHVRVALTGNQDEMGRLPYRVTGGVYAQINGGSWQLIVGSPWFLIIYDLLHPDPAAGITRLERSGFAFDLTAAAGRSIRLENRYCGRVAQLEFKAPEASHSPLVLDPGADPCGETAQQDKADPNWLAEGDFGDDVDPLSPDQAMPPVVPITIAPFPEGADPILIPGDEDWVLTDNPKGKRLYEDRLGGRAATTNFWE